MAFGLIFFGTLFVYISELISKFAFEKMPNIPFISDIVSPDLQDVIIDAITDRKGRDITIVDMSAIEVAPLSKFIIAQGSSKTNVEALADRVRERVSEDLKIKPFNYAGYGASEWIVIDYGHILVHIFLPETRERFRLEELWSDAVITNLPNDI